MADAGQAVLAPCPGCGALVPESGGPTHAYLGTVPGCWALYGEVLAREYSDAAYMRVHNLTVDAYSVQHPGRPERRTNRSVHAHLLSLYLRLERKERRETITAAMAKTADLPADALGWLLPPSSLGEITVLDVHAAADAVAHGERVNAWAAAAWRAWEPHHDKIERLARQIL